MILVIWICPAEKPARNVGVVSAASLDEAMARARSVTPLRPGETLCLYPEGKRPPGLKRRTDARVRNGLHPTRGASYVEQSRRR